jgi:tRNA (adenine22-N1)-methyltransferase
MNYDVSLRMSGRLRAIADMLADSGEKDKNSLPVVADVGCDHGYVSIYLVQKNAVAKAIAMDVRKGPLDGAAANISDFGLSDRIETRLSDGFKELKKGEADAAVIAGMGGKLMIRILQEGDPKALGLKEAVLQPQSDLEEFREYIRNKGFFIADEQVLLDEGKYYFPMKVLFGEGDGDFLKKAMSELVEKGGCDKQAAERICNRFGEHNILRKDPLLKAFLEHGKEVDESILKSLEREGHEERYDELSAELSEINILLELFGR